jgi:hypothetical protein
VRKGWRAPVKARFHSQNMRAFRRMRSRGVKWCPFCVRSMVVWARSKNKANLWKYVRNLRQTTSFYINRTI